MRLRATEARRRFAAAAVARLATVSADGAPHLVPVVFAADGERIVTAVDAKPKASRDLARLRNIRNDPRVTLLVDHYDPDWRLLWWARADGTARVLLDGPDRDRALALLRAKYAQYRETDGFGHAVVINVHRWSGWAAS